MSNEIKKHEADIQDLEDAHIPEPTLSQKMANPLIGIPRHRLLQESGDYAREIGLSSPEEVALLQRGALLAQNPHSFETLTELSEEERETIRYERAHKWRQPTRLYLTIIICSIGAATQGWDQTGSNGANLSFPEAFGILPVKGTPNYMHNEWLVGLVNAAPYIASAAIGCWLSDPLNQLFGRRGCIFITAIILIITPIASGFAQTWVQLFVIRLLLGLGMGAKGSTVPVFAAENSPTIIRGALTMSWQLWTACGIFLGNAANCVVKDINHPAAWRLQLGSAFIPAVPLVIMVYMCPESPRWLLKKGRPLDAYKSLLILRHTPLQASRDLYAIHSSLIEEAKLSKSNSYWLRVKELFVIPRVRRATVASGVVMLAQQMCGINIIAFYSSSVFSEAGYTAEQALYASLGFGALNFVFAWPAVFTIDTWGRRTLLLFTFPNMCWTLLVTGLLFLIPEEGTSKISSQGRIGLIALFIYLFTIFYSVGEGPVPFAYSAEVFPLSNREMGMSWAVTVCLGFAAVLTITFPAMKGAMGEVGAFCFYAGLNAIAFVLIFLFVPETKQKSLEELDQVFSVPTSQFIAYSTGVSMPHFVKTKILRRKLPDPAPLIPEPVDEVEFEKSTSRMGSV